jgi:hypothetical protein
MGNLLKELPVERRFGVMVQLWREFHQSTPYHIGLALAEKRNPASDRRSGCCLHPEWRRPVGAWSSATRGLSPPPCRAQSAGKRRRAGSGDFQQIMAKAATWFNWPRPNYGLFYRQQSSDLLYGRAAPEACSSWTPVMRLRSLGAPVWTTAASTRFAGTEPSG